MYAGNEVPVFPVWNLEENGCCECPNGPFCQNAGNHPIGPLVPHGLRNATTDLDQVRDWWGQYPEANIGMPTGAWSGVVVLDVDPETGGFESLLAYRGTASCPGPAWSTTGVADCTSTLNTRASTRAAPRARWDLVWTSSEMAATCSFRPACTPRAGPTRGMEPGMASSEHQSGPLAEMQVWLQTSKPASTSRIRLQERSGRTTDDWRAKRQEGEECTATQVGRRNR